MKNTTVYRLVHSFSQAEIREFRKFLVSPVFNQRDDMLELFDRLLAIGEDGDKRSVWRSLHGKLPYSDQKMRLLMSYLHRLLEQYLVWKERSMEEIENRISLAIAYRRRGMQDAFTRVQRNIENRWRNSPCAICSITNGNSGSVGKFSNLPFKTTLLMLACYGN
ncbi:MAG: hypothetical protein IPL65_05580 [Lewinellaceae bacterium]|nr:hypothetical protein [Lewinellaceae bacterium]